MNTTSLFDRLVWCDPLSGKPLEPIVITRTPGGVPVCGALRVAGTNTGYPIVDCVARLTPALAQRHRAWLELTGLDPVAASDDAHLQDTESVDSFGFQWTWNSNPRTELDLSRRVAGKFNTVPESFAGRLVIDAGAGAGDQSRYMINHGASVLSVDLSAAIDVTASKLRMNPNWFGVQGDIAHLPLAPEQFDVVYCEGVIQHTADSYATVAELKRVLKIGGRINAAHYVNLTPRTAAHRFRRRLTSVWYGFFRRRLSSIGIYPLLALSGAMAGLSRLPVIGWMLRRAGLVIHNDLMPDFRTTCTDTYDFWGSHEFQRVISQEEFVSYFDRAGGMELLFTTPGIVVAGRVA
ncbi:MAG: hypothetical protein QOE82_3723 [Thermoanaerobaculia bacterium]|nr:hypothetical protein [Thermoanaerobaculia bacterium]